MVKFSTLTLLPDERQRPSEDVHEVWQPVGVRWAVELPDVHHIVLILQYGSCKEQDNNNTVSDQITFGHQLHDLSKCMSSEGSCKLYSRLINISEINNDNIATHISLLPFEYSMKSSNLYRISPNTLHSRRSFEWWNSSAPFVKLVFWTDVLENYAKTSRDALATQGNDMTALLRNAVDIYHKSPTLKFRGCHYPDGSHQGNDKCDYDETAQYHSVFRLTTHSRRFVFHQRILSVTEFSPAFHN